MRPPSSGFTLIEVVITAAVTGIVSVIVLPKVLSPGTLTAPSQTRALGELVRRAQATAMTSQQRTRLTFSAGDGQATLAACSASQVCTDQSSLRLEQGVVGVVSNGANPLYFNSQGLPVDAAGNPLSQSTVYTVSHSSGAGSASFTVSVAPLSGRVSLSP